MVDPEEEERIAEDIRRQLLKEMGGDMPAPEQAAPAPEEESQETESVREGTEADQAAIPDPVTGPAAAGSSEASAASETTSPVQEEKADSEEKTEAEPEKEELPYRMAVSYTHLESLSTIRSRTWAPFFILCCLLSFPPVIQMYLSLRIVGSARR